MGKKQNLALELATCLLLSSFSLGLSAQETPDPVTITILYTNDEHGWMQGMDEDQSAATLYQLWQDEEGYSESGPFLVLSGGDNWTGPAISTWVEGESMVEIMNAMHYDASAVGNHEFDFGLEALAKRAGQADFPYLSANTRWKEDTLSLQDLGILPYTITEVSGISIGIIGLSARDTPYTTNPALVSDLTFIPYEAAVREAMSSIADTDLQFIIAHVCLREMESLLIAISDLGIDLAGGGHCNELAARKVGNTILLGGGYHFTSYASASFTFDRTQEAVIRTSFDTRRNRDAKPDPAITAIVDKWAMQSAEILQEVLTWNAERLPRGEILDQAIINSWLESYPEADVAMTNQGGIRAGLPKGQVTVSDIVNILPFDNTIIAAQVSGRVIARALEEGGRPVVAGVEKKDGRWVFTKSGEAMGLDQEYTLLLNSFMYAGGANFSAIVEADPEAFDTGTHYRQPFVDWLRNQNATPGAPLSF